MSDESEAKELTTKPTQELDGFDTYEESVIERLLQGTRLKFTNETTWVTNAGDEIPSNAEFIAWDVVRVEAKWSRDKKAPPFTRVVPPGDKFRDMKKLNEETPRSEWVEGPNGEPKGPWEIQHYLYLQDKLMKRYTWVTATVGGNIAVAELVQQIKDARKAYGPNAYAVVQPSDTFMPTRFGGRQRPHLIVVRFTRLRGGDGGGKAAELPNLTETAKLESLAKPTAKQVLDDEVEF